ncbi:MULTISPECIES: glycosyltransferase family 4 protein [unclassified Burkholderia]|uniref:glycosyltransferase family 4 protein n=1 Tax=unclassified Burkholderia TaxID=2613784 RepID=UPI000753F3D3|nr:MULTISPECIES: glycosyltransferase family 4 protein [unclassified Burkholderia]KVN03509.1 glycosyl transferase family 1 [Burkholderia sp. MSMB1552]KWZ55941.1 glycosyl transferase family 1 [Burkholderia sp. MSMB1588]
MRIFAVVPEAFGGHGGIARYNSDLLHALAAMPDVEEIVVVPRGTPFPVESVPVKITYRSAAVAGKFKYAKEAFLAARGGFDLVICGHINLLPLTAVLNFKIRAPLVLMVYGIDVWRPHRSRWARQLVNRLAKVWSISEFTRDAMRQWTAMAVSRFTILPNAIDLSRYGMVPKNPALARRYEVGGRKVILFLARLVSSERYKGVDEVLEVMPNLLKKLPSLLFLVAGDGDDRTRLQQKAESLGLNGHVTFTGFVPESEKRDLFGLADLFVMPGYGEGFGFVFLEALACGVPVVASRLDGSREAVRNGELGRLVDPRNRVELETAILSGINDPRSIPPGLGYFAFPEFQRRLAAAVREVSGS